LLTGLELVWGVVKSLPVAPVKPDRDFAFSFMKHLF
jgi:hypothetical protein